MIFGEVKTTIGEVKPTLSCGEEVNSTFGDENLTF